MDIEEERKAFNDVFSTSFPNLERSAEVGRNLEDLGRKETAFNGWCLAKAHAEQMAKPTVKIKPKGAMGHPTSYPFVMTLWKGDKWQGVVEDFRTYKEAEQWAKDNGYRVVNE